MFPNDFLPCVPDSGGEIGTGGAERKGEWLAGGRDRVQGKAGAGVPRGDLAGKHMHGLAKCQSPGGDGTRAFAAERTVVETALTRDDQVRGGNASLEIEPGRNEFEAGQKRGACGCHQAKGDAARGTRSGLIHKGVGLSALGAQQQAEPGAGVVELGKVGRKQALLRTINRGGPARAEEGVGDVARDADGREGRNFPGDVIDHVPSGGNGRPDGFVAAGEALKAESGKGAQPEVVRGTAADAEENGGGAGLGGRGDELAGAERGGLPRVALVWRQQRETARRGHLDHGDFAFLAHALPRYEAVVWGAQVLLEAGIADRHDPLMVAVLRWIDQPGDDLRRNAGDLAEATRRNTPARNLAHAVLMSGGSIAPPEFPAVQPPTAVCAALVTGAVLAGAYALRDPRAALDLALKLGEAIANGA